VVLNLPHQIYVEFNIISRYFIDTPFEKESLPILNPFFVTDCPKFIARASLQQTQCFQCKTHVLPRTSYFDRISSELTATLGHLVVGLPFAVFAQSQPSTSEEPYFVNISRNSNESLSLTESTPQILIGSDNLAWFKSLAYVLPTVRIALMRYESISVFVS
jgi:hypothetical protein